MSRFTVHVMRTRKVIEQAEMEIEAATEAEAIAKAQDEEDDLTWNQIDVEVDEGDWSASPIV